MAGRVQEALDRSQRHDRREDQAEDDEAIPGTMQEAGELSCAHHGTAQGEEEECEHNEENQGILKDRERPVASNDREREMSRISSKFFCQPVTQCVCA